jgi:Ca2+-binding EF-hand superfamily protein
MLTELQTRKLTKLFTMYDADNSGKIGLADFEIVVKKIAEVRGWKPNSSKMNVLLEKFSYYWIHIRGESDKNRDNKVSLDEWLNYYESILNDPKRYQAEIGSLVNLIFDAFDADGDGTINGNEWVDFLAVYNNHRIYAERAFSQIDLDKDGFISQEEFLTVFHNFHYSDEPKALGSLLFFPY